MATSAVLWVLWVWLISFQMMVAMAAVALMLMSTYNGRYLRMETEETRRLMNERAKTYHTTSSRATGVYAGPANRVVSPPPRGPHSPRAHQAEGLSKPYGKPTLRMDFSDEGSDAETGHTKPPGERTSLL